MLTDATGLSCHSEHVVELYETEDFLVDTVGSFLGQSLHGNGSVIVVATDSHRRAFEGALEVSGTDVAAAAAEGRYASIDAAELLATFMVDGRPAPDRFRASVERAIGRAGAGGRPVRIYGEMVALLWEGGDVAAAIELEDLWNDLAATQSFSLLCAYPMRAFEDEASAAAFKQMCTQHTTVIPAEDYSRLEDLDQRQRAVALLQQETAALRSEAERLRAGQEVLAQLAFVDSLTGLGNRSSFGVHLAREWALSMRDGIDSFVVVADLDGVTGGNHGGAPSGGDQVLREFAGAVASAARSTDICARIGDGQFAVLLVRCRETAAHRFKARAQEAMADPARPALAGLEVSLGHASLYASTSAAKALERAELNMTASRRAARLNRRALRRDAP